MKINRTDQSVFHLNKINSQYPHQIEINPVKIDKQGMIAIDLHEIRHLIISKAFNIKFMANLGIVIDSNRTDNSVSINIKELSKTKLSKFDDTWIYKPCRQHKEHLHTCKIIYQDGIIEKRLS